MRLRKQDLIRLDLYKPTPVKDDDGDIRNTYGQPHAEFCGSIQPYSQRNDPRDYGIDPRYAYTVYTQSGLDFEEIDRIGVDEAKYEIKVILDWGIYKRLMVEEVR